MSDIRITTLPAVSVGDFVKHTGKDKSGKWAHIGEVDKVDKTNHTFSMVSPIGYLTFHVDCFKEDELYITEKPPGWDKFKKDPDKAKEKLREKEAAAKAAKAAPVIKTLKEQVYDLVKDNPKLSEAKLLKLVRTTLNNNNDALLKTYISLADAKLKMK